MKETYSEFLHKHNDKRLLQAITRLVLSEKMTKPLISLRNLQKTYWNGEHPVYALRDIQLDIYPGEFVAIVGASGSGKSTLLSLLGFLDTPTSGDYFFNAHNVTQFSNEELAALRNQVAGFVFQQFYLLPGLTALENVALPLLYSSTYSEQKAKDQLEQLGLGHRMNHTPATLSGGERQRVSTARALINTPQVLFADEPTGSLDTRNEADVMAVLHDLHAKGMTIVMVTHEQEIATQAQRVITMRDGTIISDIYQKEKKPVQSPPSYKIMPRQMLSAPLLWLYIRQALSGMLSKKLRTFLSLLGILIGVWAVMTMIAIGSGAKNAIQQELSHLGANRLLVRPGPVKSGTVMVQATRSLFSLDDSAAIQQLPGIQNVCAIRKGRCQIVGNGKNWNTDVLGTEISYPDMYHSTPALGRFFNEKELRTRERVIVLGQTVVDRIFGHTDPLGKDVYIDKLPFTVIGVLPIRGEQGGNDYDDLVLIPITTGIYRLFGGVHVDSFEVDVVSADQVEHAKFLIKSLLYKTYNKPLTASDFLRIKDMSAIRHSIESTVQAVQLLLSIVSAIALIIGGIGIMNIMLVSVTERTREIGIRKALGATEKDILIQFLIESIVITGTGGLFGVILAIIFSKILGFITGWTIIISFTSVLLSAGFSIAIGLFFGIFPARQAAKLNTVDALRYE